MKDFFISYTGADRQWAEWIAWQLEEAGYSVIIQAWDILPGNDFIAEMDRASREAERTLAVLTPKYFQSRFTQAEWSPAFAKGNLLPVR
ncbi:MAG TPA: toll/interleukin-1 receptor domain-containing protein [Blastocatellia bacterium]